ncbi:epoxide hydrolase family protein [Rhizohabitans arisaemae]|uniref:epoxide hydrolase family protein n=1 Tax=Rhizohabitans arisaemae TaxID=2720610 RepID=UPI0024B109EB|nr:epoxide hydrolase family protein [Rhizohabitans arisaemae]
MQPFQIEIPDSHLADLRQRIGATRWPSAVDSGPGWERGVPLTYLKELASYWQEEYDWRAAEREINRYPQFTTEIDGAPVHVLHVASAVPGARPLLLTHGWPSSIVEFLDVIGPLTDPAAHGGDPADAFHVVVPSLPGHGFSGPLRAPGWDARRIAGAWAELMRRLGYDSYLTAGGDWGSLISLELGRLDPGHVTGAHLTMLLTLPSGDPAEMATLTEEDFARLGKLSRYDAELSAYLRLQSTRPLTVSYGLTDSPVGQLAWITEKFREWTDSAKTPEDAVGRDRLLTNVSVYWFTGTAASAAQLYYESAPALGALFTPGARPEPVPVPIGVAAFHGDPVTPVRAFAERDYPSISYWSEIEKGGHFPAMEQPRLLVEDIRAFARTLIA